MAIIGYKCERCSRVSTKVTKVKFFISNIHCFEGEICDICLEEVKQRNQIRETPLNKLWGLKIAGIVRAIPGSERHIENKTQRKQKNKKRNSC
jgi:hypothetical protein